MSDWDAVDSMCEGNAMRSNSWKVYAGAHGVRWWWEGVFRALRGQVPSALSVYASSVGGTPMLTTLAGTTSTTFGEKSGNVPTSTGAK